MINARKQRTVPKYPPVSDVCDEAKDGTDI
jgi:hypothetical protein